MKHHKEDVTRGFGVLLIMYLLGGLLLFLTQKSLLYHPDTQDFEACEGFKEYEKVYASGTRLYILEGSPQEVVIHYHGNAGSACDRSQHKHIFQNTGASVIFVEYSGYANDDIPPSRERILADVEHVHEYVRQQGYESITVYGQSLGSGAASYHAYLGDVQRLILVAPFSTLAEVAQKKYFLYPASLLLTENYDNVEWLGNYRGSLLILHGNRDTLIPHSLSQELFQSVPSEEKEYVQIEGAGHNEMWASPLFKQKLMAFLDQK